jgi:hypothetical protein
MATRIPKAQGVQPEIAGGLRYVARQPILDLRGRVHGYELLFRNGPEAAFRGDGNLATRTMLDNTVIFGLEKLTGGLPAFVNCTTEALTEALVDVLPPSMTVLEILETSSRRLSLIEACRRLKAEGFRLALDDFVWKPEISSRWLSWPTTSRWISYGPAPGTARSCCGGCVAIHGGAGCGEGRDAGGVPAGLRGGLHALSGLLFLPAGAAEEPQGARQPSRTFEILQASAE